jgi:cellulose biosynthesis protein BcsQ
MAFVVSLLQNKGGCGKTTLATTLYATAVSRGDSVGIIDLDPQGNATAWSIGRRGFLNVTQHTGAEALCAPGGALTGARFPGNQSPELWSQSIMECQRVPGGFLVPSNPYMNRSGMESIELDAVPFSTVVVDTPPQMQSTLLRSIVAQSDAVVIPVQPEPFCVQNIVELVSEIENAGGGEMIATGRVRFVFNMVQKCLTHASWAALVSSQWSDMLSDVSIARAAAWADMSNHAAKWNPKSKPAKIANELWDDIHKHAQRRAAA